MNTPAPQSRPSRLCGSNRRAPSYPAFACPATAPTARALFGIGLVAVSLHSTSGCRPRPEGFCRVEGRVTVDALPVEAELTFYPLEGTAARPVIVVTDAAGRFIVDPRSPKQQLPPGRYRIDIRIRSVHHVPETANSDGEPKAGKGRMPTYLLTVRLQRRLSAPVTRLRFALRS